MPADGTNAAVKKRDFGTLASSSAIKLRPFRCMGKQGSQQAHHRGGAASHSKIATDFNIVAGPRRPEEPSCDVVS
jgi:hypothetical protein